MAWVAVNKNGEEKIFRECPKRIIDGRGTSKPEEYWKDINSCSLRSYTINFLKLSDNSIILKKVQLKN